jgi:hypothetical protein
VIERKSMASKYPVKTNTEGVPMIQHSSSCWTFDKDAAEVDSHYCEKHDYVGGVDDVECPSCLSSDQE